MIWMNVWFLVVSIFVIILIDISYLLAPSCLLCIIERNKLFGNFPGVKFKLSNSWMVQISKFDYRQENPGWINNATKAADIRHNCDANSDLSSAVYVENLRFTHYQLRTFGNSHGIIFESDTINEVMERCRVWLANLTWFSSLAPLKGHAKTESPMSARHQRCISVPKVRDSQRSHPSAVLIRVCPRQETRGWWLVKHSGHYHHMTTFLHSVPILSPAPAVTLLFTDWSDHTTEECWIELANEPSRR